MNSEKKSVRIRLILGIPFLIFFILINISVIWIPDIFVGMGLNYADRYTVSIAVITSFLIGFLTSQLLSYLQKKYK